MKEGKGEILLLQFTKESNTLLELKKMVELFCGQRMMLVKKRGL